MRAGDRTVVKRRERQQRRGWTRQEMGMLEGSWDEGRGPRGPGGVGTQYGGMGRAAVTTACGDPPGKVGEGRQVREGKAGRKGKRRRGKPSEERGGGRGARRRHPIPGLGPPGW